MSVPLGSRSFPTILLDGPGILWDVWCQVVMNSEWTLGSSMRSLDKETPKQPTAAATEKTGGSLEIPSAAEPRSTIAYYRPQWEMHLQAALIHSSIWLTVKSFSYGTPVVLKFSLRHAQSFKHAHSASHTPNKAKRKMCPTASKSSPHCLLCWGGWEEKEGEKAIFPRKSRVNAPPLLPYYH